jgi:hypothetical protein
MRNRQDSKQRGSNEVECVWNQDITAQVDSMLCSGLSIDKLPINIDAIEQECYVVARYFLKRSHQDFTALSDLTMELLWGVLLFKIFNHLPSSER